MDDRRTGARWTRTPRCLRGAGPGRELRRSGPGGGRRAVRASGRPQVRDEGVQVTGAGVRAVRSAASLQLPRPWALGVALPEMIFYKGGPIALTMTVTAKTR